MVTYALERIRRPLIPTLLVAGSLSTTTHDTSSIESMTKIGSPRCRPASFRSSLLNFIRLRPTFRFRFLRTRPDRLSHSFSSVISSRSKELRVLSKFCILSALYASYAPRSKCLAECKAIPNLRIRLPFQFRFQQ